MCLYCPFKKKTSFLKAFLMQGKKHMEEQMFYFKKDNTSCLSTIVNKFTVYNIK